MIVAPREAFERLRTAPSWGWAFLITIVLGAIGALLSMPAAMHGFTASAAHQMAANAQYAQMNAAQRQQVLAFTLLAVRFAWIFVPLFLLFSSFLQTIVMLVFNAIGGGSGTFKTLWACAMNIAVPGFGLYQFAIGIINAARGPTAYNSSLDYLLAMPSLGWLFPHGSPATVAFFSTFNPFSIWSLFLTAAAMLTVARTSRINAYLPAVLIVLVAALFAMGGQARS